MARLVVMYKTPKDAAASKTALDFFAWAYASGTEMAAALDYVPVPASLVKQVQATWTKSILDGGKPLWAAH